MILHHLDDLLRPIETLSLRLQKKNLHPFDAMVRMHMQHKSFIYIINGTVQLIQMYIKSMMIEVEETFLDDDMQLCGRSFTLLKSNVDAGSISLSGGGLAASVLLSCEKTIKG